ncbi:glutamate racemase [uncultured Microscilla sp.]|uniref:glutamate racemase n=1 Tax=uncultured Microscilla sp. TaxID=432653 RepID=UPI00262CCECC|nr:glutamate racemase [uncultured Microscilla sp.]
MDTSNAIGIFDSGIGGLTVARAVRQLLPQESIIYFGDTAHLPYGDKSTAALQAYAIKICNVLLQQNCKVILMACNSASVAAYDLVKEYVGSRAKVMNVIEPMINYIHDVYAGKSVGLIGTKQTILSNVYKKKVDQLGAGIDLRSLATPLLVPMIEENFFKNSIRAEIIDAYLSREELKDIDALILGCTHYPLIKASIQKFYNTRVEVLDSSEIVASSLKGMLEMHNLTNKSGKVLQQFYVSDFTQSFETSTQLFFGKHVQLTHYPLWE